jgi:ISXO2-like transposase domain
MRRFHGVATKNLPSYLSWRRTIEALSKDSVPDALEPYQQNSIYNKKSENFDLCERARGGEGAAIGEGAIASTRRPACRRQDGGPCGVALDSSGVCALMKRWGLSTYHGLRRKHVDSYLNEFDFRRPSSRVHLGTRGQRGGAIPRSAAGLSRDSRPGQRIGNALAVEINEGVMDGLVERGGVGRIAKNLSLELLAEHPERGEFF